VLISEKAIPKKTAVKPILSMDTGAKNPFQLGWRIAKSLLKFFNLITAANDLNSAAIQSNVLLLQA
jgi:hypothetical protein